MKKKMILKILEQYLDINVQNIENCSHEASVSNLINNKLLELSGAINFVKMLDINYNEVNAISTPYFEKLISMR